eukprot:scaffold96600_cov51-Attheya_sp.AAC.4
MISSFGIPNRIWVGHGEPPQCWSRQKTAATRGERSVLIGPGRRPGKVDRGVIYERTISAHLFYHLFLGDRTNEKVMKKTDVVWVIGMSEKEVIETYLKSADIEKVIGRNEKVKK